MPFGTAGIPICICMAASWSAASMSGAACTRCSMSGAPLAAFTKKLEQAKVPDLRACQVGGTVLLRMVRGWLMLPQSCLEICQAKGRWQRTAGSRCLAIHVPGQRSIQE